MNRMRSTAALAIAPSYATIGPDTAAWPGERRVSSGHRTLASNGATPAYNNRRYGTPTGQRGRSGSQGGMFGLPPIVTYAVIGLGLYFVAKKLL